MELRETLRRLMEECDKLVDWMAGRMAHVQSVRERALAGEQELRRMLVGLDDDTGWTAERYREGYCAFLSMLHGASSAIHAFRKDRTLLQRYGEAAERVTDNQQWAAALPVTYGATLVEMARRREFDASFASLAEEQMASLRTMADDESARRRAFARTHGVQLPNMVVRQWLDALPSYSRPVDPGLPPVSESQVRVAVAALADAPLVPPAELEKLRQAVDGLGGWGWDGAAGPVSVAALEERLVGLNITVARLADENERLVAAGRTGSPQVSRKADVERRQLEERLQTVEAARERLSEGLQAAEAEQRRLAEELKAAQAAGAAAEDRGRRLEAELRAATSLRTPPYRAGDRVKIVKVKAQGRRGGSRWMVLRVAPKCAGDGVARSVPPSTHPRTPCQGGRAEGVRCTSRLRRTASRGRSGCAGAAPLTQPRQAGPRGDQGSGGHRQQRHHLAA